ncbi:WSC domain-containing protein, partial [Lasiosphaeria miniovina]
LALLSAILPLATATYFGCYTETSPKALASASTANFTTMTIELCQQFCTVDAPGAPYALWGLEYSGECYCANALTAGSFPTFETDCSAHCAGDATETCGGGNRLSLYGSGTTPPAFTPQSHPGGPVTAFSPQGCWTEGVGVRALGGAMAASDTLMTIEACASFCLNSGFLRFGTEYARECWCDNAQAASSNLTTNVPSDCSFACTGNSGEVCGAGDRLSVYLW